ncbi:MAG: aminoglycoside phosphotransferase family protein [Dehalococcoidia bacterium]
MLEATKAVPAGLDLKGASIAGEAGREWRRLLPATVAGLAERWSLTIDAPFPGLSYNYVAPVTQADGTPAVLKLWMPLPREFEVEVEALSLYDGNGAVKLLQVDADDRAMLLERAEPGTDLWQLDDDDRQIEVAATVMRRLWRPPPLGCSLPHARAHYERLGAQLPGLAPAGFPLSWLATALDIYAALESAAPPVVLHEDLHQANILRARREPWLAIDPHGLIGPRELETTQMVLNVVWRAEPAGWPRIITRYVHALSEQLGLDTEQVRLAGVARSVLEAFWTLEDQPPGKAWQRDIAIAESFAAAR